MAGQNRSEEQVIAELMDLTAQSGYVYAIAAICHRDDLVMYGEELVAENLERIKGTKRLIRTEITTLLGLMVRQPIDLQLPTLERMQELVNRTDALMSELHRAMNQPSLDSIRAASKNQRKDEVWQGAAMREPIFYGSESAYPFQYRDLFVEKHAPDDHWLLSNKGFTSAQAQNVARAMCSLMNSRVNLAPSSDLDHLANLLSPYEFTAEAVAEKSRLAIEIVENVFRALTLDSSNDQFKEIGDFNAVCATPLLPSGRGSVLLFQQYAIYEALYESPFFWMLADKTYRATASDNRGAFAEKFAHRRLAEVFGRGRVHSNVNIFDSKEIVGEADVLVVYADKLIIVQAKAKKLTLAARKGNDGQLKSDFAAAIQKAYDQGYECAEAILSGRCHLIDSAGAEIKLPEDIKDIYPVCLVSDHYPALAFQAAQYLEHTTTEIIRPPFVMDVFLLDVLVEMLASPLRFLSYVDLRVAAINEILASHELTTLAFHLRRNLWLDPQYNMFMLEDSISTDLDVAMMVRRDGFPGQRTPPGILTAMAGTLYEHLISQIEWRNEPSIISLGLQLLALGEQTCRNIDRGLMAITSQSRSDGAAHDFTIQGADRTTGICFHCNPSPTPRSIMVLQAHCLKRKYSQRASKWFGVSVNAYSELQFGASFDFPWEKDEKMDVVIKDAKPPSSAAVAIKALERQMRPKKYGRNEPCPCGSDQKYKKCCGAP
ncbi:prepilin peptidase [Aeromonas caviae]|nr:prepilin peptidase [Aeromonas caviae]